MIYQILTDYFRFRTLRFTRECAARMYERAQAARAMGNTSGSMAIVYDRLEVEWYDEPERPTPDITYLKEKLVFSPKAYTALNKLVPASAECFPIILNGETWHIINLLENMNHQLAEISDNETVSIAENGFAENAALSFKDESILPELFYIKAAGKKFYCKDEFKRLCDENNLQGMILTTDLLTMEV